MAPIGFAIIGGGWRADYYLRIAQAMPERFAVPGMLVRDPAKGQATERRWGVRTYRTLEALLAATSPLFVVTSVSWEANPGFVQALAQRGIPVLSETPPAPDLERLRQLWGLAERGARIQVAEQYIYQPHHAARLALVGTGALGRVSQVHVSICHGYHGVSLLRHFLGVTFDNARITARRFVSPLVGGPDRKGPPTEERTVQSTETIAWLDFGDRLGIFDFCGDQYFSYVRGQRLLVRGERGEIIDQTARYLLDYRTPVELAFQRVQAGADGNLEGHCIKGILGGERWLYLNPFAPARLMDDEVAVAALLAKMADYVAGGADPYPLAEACQDRYFDILIDQAARTGEPVHSETQPWATT